MHSVLDINLAIFSELKNVSGKVAKFFTSEMGKILHKYYSIPILIFIDIDRGKNMTFGFLLLCRK